MAPKSPKKDELVFLPLGGCGEIGMNLNLFGFGPEHARKWIIVDCGVTFGNADTPGIDIIMPDTEFIEEYADDVLAIVLTHAHEDHMGAVARLWPRLRCPVYATPFTKYLTEGRFSEFGLLDEVDIREVPLGGQIVLGPFDIEFFSLTHSIPEPNALIIRTALGTILHTGDWKIDPAPQIGEPIDIAALKQFGKDGILAMICDSTNVFSPGRAGSEEGVREELVKVISEFPDSRVAVASFASNVARLESVMFAAKQNRRSVCLVGRSMHRMTEAAKAVGMLKGMPAFISEEEAKQMPDSHVLYLCTGSQGEPRAALSRIASGSHRNVSLDEGDVVIFSSKIIPGNEKGIFALQNALADKGVHLVTEKDRDIHVSGHPCRDELTDMYDWVRPEIAVPVHGERRHLLEHAELARELGVKKTIAPHNGEVIRLSPNGPKIVDIVPSGRLHQDGNVIVSDLDNGLRERRKMSFAGHVGVSLVIDKKGHIVLGPEPRLSGFPEGDREQYLDPVLDDVERIAERAFKSIKAKSRKDEDHVEDVIAAAIKRHFRSQGFKRPLVNVTAFVL